MCAKVTQLLRGRFGSLMLGATFTNLKRYFQTSLYTWSLHALLH